MLFWWSDVVHVSSWAWAEGVLQVYTLFCINAFSQTASWNDALKEMHLLTSFMTLKANLMKGYLFSRQLQRYVCMLACVSHAKWTFPPLGRSERRPDEGSLLFWHGFPSQATITWVLHLLCGNFRKKWVNWLPMSTEMHKELIAADRIWVKCIVSWKYWQYELLSNNLNLIKTVLLNLDRGDNRGVEIRFRGMCQKQNNSEHKTKHTN